MKQKLQEIQIHHTKTNSEDQPISLPWIETLDITTNDVLCVENVHDDLQRELTFYTQSLEGVKKAHTLFDELHIEFKRPNDYFAEMVKSDQHMQKVKSKLITEKKTIEQSEERKRQKDMKKYGKQVQVQQQQERQKKKKAEIQSIEKWRKARLNNQEDEFSVSIEDDLLSTVKSQQGSNRQKNDPQRKPKFNKADLKAKKYGFGGKKKGNKRNTSDSASDMSSFSVRSNRPDKNTTARGKTNPKNIKKRPGNATRKRLGQAQNKFSARKH